MPVVLVQLIENPPWVKRNSEGESADSCSKTVVLLIRILSVC